MLFAATRPVGDVLCLAWPVRQGQPARAPARARPVAAAMGGANPSLNAAAEVQPPAVANTAARIATLFHRGESAPVVDLGPPDDVVAACGDVVQDDDALRERGQHGRAGRRPVW